MKKLLLLAVTGYFALAGLLVFGLHFHYNVSARRQVQPIQFPHATHINKVGLACTKCHITVTNSPAASAPPLAVCMECHTKAKLDSPEIKILTKHWTDKDPVEWSKIHQLPWHVRFNHKRHIAANVDCSVCHGEVKTMLQVHQVRSLEMGWCVSCHRDNNAPTDCWTCHK